jgi:alkyl sulfatase BDS1-like metallo-beta-lactamase superfamily hydrolase
MMNAGLVGSEIAEALVLPPALEQAWHTRGYYGSVSHNVKAIYQRYMGWYDGNPANLWQHPPVERAVRYLEFMGGADAVVDRARTSYDAGDYRWVAEVLSHVVFAEPGHAGARELLAETFEQLGYGSENGTWRCAYLSGAHELRRGGFGTPAVAVSADMLAALDPTQLFDSMAIRVNGPRCWGERILLDVDLGEAGHYRLRLTNGVLTYSTAPQAEAPDLTLRLSRAALPALLGTGRLTAESLAALGVLVEGDLGAVSRLMATMDAPDPDFAIVTP